MRLTGAVVLAWLILVVPALYQASLLASPAVPPVQLLIAGVILGIGRQGIDLLALRVIVAAIALPAGWVVGPHAPTCGTLLCLQERLVALEFIALLTAVALGFVAIVTSLLWNRGSGSLRPEFPWGRLPRPRSWWQWALVILAIVILGYLGLALQGIPSY